MRSNFLTSDMDFRVIPSAIPLQSPSPDRKCVNLIAPTISPNAIQIKRGLTPPKYPFKPERQINKNIHEYDTQIKNERSTQKQMQSSAIKEKDEIIKNLRNVIDMITDNNRHKRNNEEDVMQLKNQIKILTIENQKMVNIIDKFQKAKSNTQDRLHTEKIQQYENKISELNKAMKQNQHFTQEELKELKRFNKSLNTQLKNIENQRKELELQNKKLMKILKEKNQFEKTGTQKMKLSDTSENSIEDKTQILITNKSNERLTLVKIRQQHSQNIRALREGLIRQIQQTFQSMKQAFDGINNKVISLSSRLESIEKRNLVKSHVQRQTITINIIQKEAEVNESQEIDRSFKIERKNNSEIYIQEALSSSHDKISRDQFGQLEEVPSYKNLTSHLEEQLNTTKTELNDLRSKYEKICMDTGISFSQGKVDKDKNNEKIQQSYKQALKQIEDKNEQIQTLRSRVREVEIRYIERLKQSQSLSEKFTNQLSEKREEYEKELEQIQEQTSEKVNMIIETYEKQIQILQKQKFNLTSQVEQLKRKLSQKEESSNFILQLNNRQQENNQLIRQLNNMKLEKESMEKKIEILENLQVSLGQDVQRLKVQVEQLLEEKRQAENQVGSLKSMIVKYQQQLEDLRNWAKQRDEEINLMKATSQNEKNLLRESNYQLSYMNSVNQAKIKKYKEKIEELENPFEVIRQLEKVQTLSDLASKEIQQMRQSNSQIDSQLLLEIEAMAQVQRNQSLNLYSKIQKVEEQNIRLQHEVQQLQSIINFKEQSLNKQRERNELMTEKLNTALKSIQKGKAQRFEKYGTIEQKNKQIHAQIGIIKQLQQRRAIKLSDNLNSDFIINSQIQMK